MNKKNILINLGCRLNIYEGEIIKSHLKNNNLENVTVINSCAVTADAEKKVAYEIRKVKKNNPKNKIIVTGCAAQINPKKYDNLEEVDLVVAYISEKSSHSIVLSKGSASVHPGADSADITLRMTTKVAEAVHRGSLSALTAIQEGDIVVGGNISDLLRCQSVLAAVDQVLLTIG